MGLCIGASFTIISPNLYDADPAQPLTTAGYINVDDLDHDLSGCVFFCLLKVGCRVRLSSEEPPKLSHLGQMICMISSHFTI